MRLTAVVGDDTQIGPAFQALSLRADEHRSRKASVAPALASLIGLPAAGATPSGVVCHRTSGTSGTSGNDWRALPPYGAPPTGQTLARLLTGATHDEWARWARRHPVALAEAVLRTPPPDGCDDGCDDGDGFSAGNACG